MKARVMPVILVFLVLLSCVVVVGADEIQPIDSCRLLDTRPGSPLQANTALEIDVRGECLIPEHATGVIFNLTVVNPVATGFLKAFGSITAPDTAIITFNSGQTVVTTGALVWLSVDDENTGSYDPPAWGIKALSSQETDIVIDVTGYTTKKSEERYRGTVQSKESAIGPPRVFLELDTLAPPISLVCSPPWIDPEHCDEFQVDEEVCGVGHFDTDGGSPEIFVHTMTDCL